MQLTFNETVEIIGNEGSVESLDPQEDRKIYVAIFGAAGSGKRDFIDKVLGREDTVTDRPTNSASSDDTVVHEYTVSGNSTDSTLLDFPGFDDSNLANEEVFLQIIDWLEKSYRNGQQLSCVLFFHPIRNPLENLSDLTYLRMFKKLCGHERYRNVVLAVTGCERERDEMAEAREEALKDTTHLWGEMIEEDCRVEHIPVERQKCMVFLLKLTDRVPAILDIQHQMVDQGRSLSDTNVAMDGTSFGRLQAIQDAEDLERKAEEKRHEASLKRLRQRGMAIVSEHDEVFRQLIASQTAEFEKLAIQRKQGTIQQRDYAEAQNRRTAAFEQQKLALVQYQKDEEIERSGLDKEHAKRLVDLDNARLCRRSKLHRLSQRAQHVRLESMGQAKQAFEYVYERFHDPGGVHQQRFCNHCLEQLTLFDTIWGCPSCETEPETECKAFITVCKPCKIAGKGCLNQDHELKEYAPNGWEWCPPLGNCLRARGIKDVSCDHCAKAPGSLFLHCCSCKDDDFDLCIDCWGIKGATCLNPTEHSPLLVFGWAPYEERY